MFVRITSPLLLAALLAGPLGTLRAESKAAPLTESELATMAEETTTVSEKLRVSELCEQRAEKVKERAAEHRERADELRRRPITPAYKNPLSKQRPRYHVREAQRLEQEAADLMKLSNRLVVAAMRDHLRQEVD